MKRGRKKGKREKKLQVHGLGVIPHLVTNELLLQLVGDEALVLLKALLDMHLELDDVVEHAHSFGVKLLAQRVGPQCELFIPVEAER